jgi:Tol biopolymer transport system component
VLARSLEKLPADRFPNAGEFKSALANESYRYTAVPQPVPDTAAGAAATAPIEAVAATNPAPKRTALIATATVAGLAIIAAIAGWTRSAPEPPAPAPAMRAELDLGGNEITNISGEIIISPDGSRLAAPFGAGGLNIGARSDGLWIRNSDESDFRLIPGTQGAVQASFSPDSRWIVYSDREGLYRVSVEGGAPQPILLPGEVAGVSFPSWGVDGWVVFSSREGLARVRDTGGPVEEINDDATAYSARGLPGGRAIIYSAANPAAVWVQDLGSDSARVLVPDAIDPTFIPATGHLLWIDGARALWAAPFDPDRAEIVGDRSLVLPGLSAFPPLFGRYSVSSDGTLVYSSGATGGFRGRFGAGRQLLVAGFDGDRQVVELDPRVVVNPTWSPDGRSVAYSGTGPNASDSEGNAIWTYDLELESAPVRITNEGTNFGPLWSPDGRRIAFSSAREGTDESDLFVKSLDTDDPPRLVARLPGRQTTMDWPEENLIVFESFPAGSDAAYGIYTVDPDDSASVRPYWTPEADANSVKISPDGTLAAYDSNESDQREVYVRSFPEPRQETLISERGGVAPFWSPGGDTLYYFNLTRDTLYAARLRLEPTPAVLSREPVMALQLTGGDLHPDGDRFIETVTAEQAAQDVADSPPAPERHFVVTNWFEELRARTGGGDN